MSNTAENIEQTEEVTIDRETMVGDMVQCVLDELKVLPKPWQAMPEQQQKDTLHRIQDRCESVIEQVVDMIAAEGFVTLEAALEQTVIKDGIKMVLTSSIVGDEFFKFMEASPKRVKVVAADSKRFVSAKGIPKADPDQADMIAESDENLNEKYDSDTIELAQQAAQLVVKEDQASLSQLQRLLKIGFNDAARIMNILEANGVVSPIKEDGTREVLFGENDIPWRYSDERDESETTEAG